MKKPATKRTPKTSSLELDTSEPWDTMLAQILVQIDHALKPSNISLDNYSIMFSIPRILSKPGLSLSNSDDYDKLLLRARAMNSTIPTINFTIIENGNGKENEDETPSAATSKGKGKKVRIYPLFYIFYFNLLMLWSFIIEGGTDLPRKCAKKQLH